MVAVMETKCLTIENVQWDERHPSKQCTMRRETPKWTMYNGQQLAVKRTFILHHN